METTTPSALLIKDKVIIGSGRYRCVVPSRRNTGSIHHRKNIGYGSIMCVGGKGA